MIVPITGNVAYTITLDPTVWIFDDRKVILEDAFSGGQKDSEKSDELERASERFNRAINGQTKPPVNRSISKMEGKEILKHSYLMPIRDFLENAEINTDAKDASLITANGEEHLSLEQLLDSYFLFSLDGKPLKKDGPVHLYYGDGSNQKDPIKNVQKIRIN
ncbi:hypothetical protein [Lentibacillus sediminis]|uniref:hypothetical protein n=1 Tax=Lentibacillus sediminis TaxID=1940529 RepID=UPI000C1C3659|nr:hypothetical protein [Lentibacillus sediminis]